MILDIISERNHVNKAADNKSNNTWLVSTKNRTAQIKIFIRSIGLSPILSRNRQGQSETVLHHLSRDTSISALLHKCSFQALRWSINVAGLGSKVWSLWRSQVCHCKVEESFWVFPAKLIKVILLILSFACCSLSIKYLGFNYCTEVS